MSKLLQRAEIKTMIKILDTVHQSQLQKRTNLATVCKMSYDQFVKYVEILILFELLEICPLTKTSKTVKITKIGINILRKLQKTYN